MKGNRELPLSEDLFESPLSGACFLVKSEGSRGGQGPWTRRKTCFSRIRLEGFGVLAPRHLVTFNNYYRKLLSFPETFNFSKLKVVFFTY